MTLTVAGVPIPRDTHAEPGFLMRFYDRLQALLTYPDPTFVEFENIAEFLIRNIKK